MYTDAKELYARHGVDTDAAIRTALSIPISINCWQGDDVIGFEKGARALSGGIQTTGNYPGRARTPEELAADFESVAAMWTATGSNLRTTASGSTWRRGWESASTSTRRASPIPWSSTT